MRPLILEQRAQGAVPKPPWVRARPGQPRPARERRSSSHLALARSLAWLTPFLAGCVVSTASPPGKEPVIPQKPQAAAPQASSATEQGGPLEVGARHILISYRGASHAAPYITRSKDEARFLAVALRERALGGEDFGELAKENSDDRGSAAGGGQLGRFRREQMVPQFSTAAFALEPGGVSDIVESQFGFHIIQRTE